MASRSQPLTALTRRATIILLEFGAEKDEAARVHTIVWRSSECARWVAWDWLRQRKGANAELHDELSGKGIASEADAEKFVQELNDFFENPKQSFPQVVGRLRDGAGEFVDRLGGFLRDPTSTSEHPDEILGDVFGVVAAARGFSDDGLRRIARCIMMELCR